nr:AsmA family protein [sulfur-oxidizing endosymbiont of Gigantopelta aegis]
MAKIIGLLLVVFIIISLAVIALVDVNQYKDEIVQLVEQESGLKLEIQGDMKLSLFSGFKFNAENVKLFLDKELIADVESLRLGMRLYSLYKGQPHITSVKLRLRTLNIFRDKNDQYNFLPLLKNTSLVQVSTQADQATPSSELFALNSLNINNIQLSIERFQYLDDLESISIKLNNVKADLSLLPIIDHHELVIDDPRVLVAYNYKGQLEIQKAFVNHYQISDVFLKFNDEQGKFVADKVAFKLLKEGVKHASPPLLLEADGHLSVDMAYSTPKGANEPLWSKPDLIKVGRFDFNLSQLKITQAQYQLETQQSQLSFEEVSIFKAKQYQLDNLVLSALNFNSQQLKLKLAKEGEYVFKHLSLKLNHLPVMQKGEPIVSLSNNFLRQFAQQGRINFVAQSLTHQSQALNNIKLLLLGQDNKVSLKQFQFHTLESQLIGDGELLLQSTKQKNLPDKWQFNMRSEQLNLAPLSELFNLPSKLEGFVKLDSHLAGSFKAQQWSVYDGHLKAQSNNIKVYGIDINDLLENYQDSQSVGLLDVGAIALMGPAGVIVTKGQDYRNLLGSFENKGNSVITQLNTNISLVKGIATMNDVAFSTGKFRLAVKGQLDLTNKEFVDFEVATIDKKGCPIFQESVMGSLNDPTVKKVNFLVKGVVNPINSLVSKVTKPLAISCDKPFYIGVVKH